MEVIHEELEPFKISRSKIRKPFEEIHTNTTNIVCEFVVDEFMIEKMIDIYEILKNTKLGTTSRRSLSSTQFEKNAGVHNKCRVKSMIIGKRYDYYKREYCECAYDLKHGKELFNIIKELIDYICKKYNIKLDINTATINQDFRCSKHKDKNNKNKSITFSLGDFDGGRLEIFDSEDNYYKTYDTKFNPILFDGSKYSHQVEEFKGRRYSVVGYEI